MTEILMLCLLIVGTLNFRLTLKKAGTWNNDCAKDLVALIVYIVAAIIVFK